MLERTSDRWVSIVLSVLLHGTLVALLVYGFWTFHESRPPTPTLAIEGTVVDSRSLNPAALKTPPAPQPPAPVPAPPVPVPVPEPEPAETTGPPEPTPEELAQREQAQKEQADKEQARKEQADRQALEKQHLLDEQKAQEQAQRQAEEKRQAVQKQREAQDKADAERKAADAKRLAEQKRAEAAQRLADDKARQESEAELKNSLAAEEHAEQLRSSGALVNWVGQIQGRIQRAWLRPPSARPGIECVLRITQAPGGVVLSAKIESCNGDQAVRESIEAAAYRASPLPPPPDPALFERDLEVTFRPD
jgi:colicin import membrane protein